jgi:hypothetical protein
MDVPVPCVLAVVAAEFAKVVPYCQANHVSPNFPGLLQSLIVAGNAKAAQDMASQLVKNEGGPMIEINAVVDLFAQYNRLQECTSFLLDVLSGDKHEQGYLQTRLLEMNLIGGAPAVVDAILGHGMFSHFDKPHIARLCEKAGLIQRALELYSDLADFKRCIVRTNVITPEFMIKFFGELTTTGAAPVRALAGGGCCMRGGVRGGACFAWVRVRREPQPTDCRRDLVACVVDAPSRACFGVQTRWSACTSCCPPTCGATCSWWSRW